MSSVNRLQDLIAKLEEMFELDKTELDFGLHRIIKARHSQVQDYLKNRLPIKVSEVLQATQQGASQEKLAAAKSKVIEAFGNSAIGEDGHLLKYGESQIGQRYLEVFEESRSYDIGALNDDVYRHLLTFFARYYEDGDFISQRRYTSKGKERYSIPYNGEEVLLHWANKDQYYIKSSEDLKDYRFTLGEGAAERVVKFQLVAQDPVENNNKAKRILELAREEEGQIAEESLPDGKPALVIPFRFSLVPKARTAPESKQFIDALLKSLPAAWQPFLAAKAATDKDKDRTQLAKHFANYQCLGSRDYFIHKNLGAFLRHELDHYIKTEVMDLDDVDAKGPEYLSREIRKIKAIRAVALDLITFLAQFENFQKKLWLKKKFVTRTDYLVTIDRLSPTLRDIVAANTAQWAEWEKLGFKPDPTKEKTQTAPKGKKAKAAEQQEVFAFAQAEAAPDWGSRAYLDANNKLVADTRFFPTSFIQQILATREVLAGAESLDAAQTGLLIHSENFQALNLLQERYREQVKCIYIDPPYNTDASPIDYKNGYKSSTWICLMDQRLESSKNLLLKDGVISAAIDDIQQKELSYLMSDKFDGNMLGTICVRSNPSGRPTATGYAVSHEYVIFAGKTTNSCIKRLPPTEDQMARFREKDAEGPFEWRNLRREGSNSDRDARRKLYYPIYISDDKIRVPKMNWNNQEEVWKTIESPKSGEIEVYPNNEDGEEKTWRWGASTVESSMNLLAVRDDRSGKKFIYYKRRPNEEGVVSVSSWFDAKYSATEHGTALLGEIFKSAVFSYPKSIFAVKDSIYVSGASEKKSIVLDFFGGSGTTGHAVINLNREDAGQRKFILVEMGRYFDTVLKPRIAKVLYSPEWKDGQAQSHGQGSSALVKVLRLESYEDTLNNLLVNQEKDLLGLFSEVKEEYLLSYMLDVETEESLLDLKKFTDPWAYQLKIYDPESGKALPQPVDLVETFNYLLGLRLSETRFETINGCLFQSLEGLDARAQSLLVIWRQLSDDPEQDRKNLESFLAGHRGFNPKDSEYHAIYINGDHNLHDPHKKIQPLEATFHRLMFEAREE